MSSQSTMREQVLAPIRLFGSAIASQRGGLFNWVPVFLALGIGGFFSVRSELPAESYVVVALAGLLCVVATSILPEDFRPVPTAAAIVIAGLLLAGGRSHFVAEPVLEFRYYGPVQGRIVKIDRSQSDVPRLTLDQVVLRDTEPVRTPTRVRVSMHGQQGYFTPEPGQIVIMTAHLSPPSGPVEPGGFDFQRHAWFDGLGALGYTRTPVLIYQPADTGVWSLALHRLRLAISRSVRSQIDGAPGAFAAAVLTGDRSALDETTTESLRASNLSHLLAISGLHMGLLTGFVFSLLRYGLALIPGLALRWPTKKIAAMAALAAGAFYLALSGANVATERAFIMVAVMFCAVLLDRRALTLRAVAVAAVIVLVWRPEVLTEPGFQMSFAATTALVAVFGFLRDAQWLRKSRILGGIATLVISSGVAGLATAPVAAAHFNRIADYGLIANLLSVPMMGMIVMPGAVVAAVLAPFGLASVGFAIMEPGIRWILAVAARVSSWDGAVTHVVSPPPFVLPLIAFGALWVILIRGPVIARQAGTVVLAGGFILWAQGDRPAVLISDTGGLIGVMTDAGRVLSKDKGDGFAAQSWLENDGDGATQALAYGRGGMGGEKGHVEVVVGDLSIVHISGRGSRERAATACGLADLVITAATVEMTGEAPACRLLDAKALRDLGSAAIVPGADKDRVVFARDISGNRLWNSSTVRRQFGYSTPRDW